jgi:hypothetical protein
MCLKLAPYFIGRNKQGHDVTITLPLLKAVMSARGNYGLSVHEETSGEDYCILRCDTV